MITMILSILAMSCVAYAVWTAYAVFIHYCQAQCLGVPILISPVGVSNILWLILQDSLAPKIELLPFGMGSWVRYNRRSWIWQFSDRGRIHLEYGPIIAHVTPMEIQIWVADKDVANELIKGKDRTLFAKPREEIERIDFMGPHLMTADGETWKRHRRIVATPFTQRNNRIVWKESLYQGLKLGEHWHEQSSHSRGVTTMWKDNEVAAMNVMVTAGFGLAREHHKDLFDKRGSSSLDFHSSLSFMVTQFMWVVVIPSSLWFPKYLPPWPESLRTFFKSVKAFKEHLDRMVAESKESAAHSSGSTGEAESYTEQLGSNNLLTALVRHSEELKTSDQGTMPAAGKNRNSLSNDEIYSNLFGLAFAGHETTAHTLAYSLFLLAAYPEQQAWVAEEVREVAKDVVDIENMDLDRVYPQLMRTRAVMYETLRLFTPLANVLKRNLSSREVTLHVGSRKLLIPPRAFVLPSLYSLHVLEEYWGSNSLEWKPQRWISNNEFVQPSPAGTFLPWSDGPRVCPGMRFSQVEFVAVCTALLSKYDIEVVCMEGEDEEMAKGRIKAALEDSTSVVTLMVKHPDRLPIRLRRI